MSHLLNDRFQVSIKWHEEAILFSHDLFLIEEFLHCFIITLLSIEGKSLQLHLIFSIVKNGLRQQDVGRNGVVQVSKLWPPTRIDCHGVQLVSIFKPTLPFSDVLFAHGFQ